jgi:hypothetical protein
MYVYPDCDWLITNPPFRLAQEFIEHGLDISRHGVAVIVRSAFLEGKGRYQDLFSVCPPTTVAQFVERVPMCKGQYDPKVSSATAYSWLVWDRPKPVSLKTDFIWIPHCRSRLEHPDDVQIGLSL